MNEVVVPLLVGLVVSVFALCGGRAALSGAPRWPLVIAGLGLLLAGVAVSLALPGRNVAVAVLDFVLEAKQVAVASLGIGALLGLLVGSALYRPVLPATGFLAGLAPAALYLAALFGLSALPNFEQLRVLLVAPDDGRAEASGITDGFRVEVLHALRTAPTSIALGPDGLIHVSGYWGDADHRGVVARLVPDGRGGFEETFVVDRMNRPHGIAFHEGDLYISRSGQFSRAVGGRMEVVNTGAVTRARDLNGDGVYDDFVDVLGGLPGAKGGLHQNNGLAFDEAGWMYVGTGTPDDHKPAVHPLDGVILRSRPDGSEVETFAEGFRNPYDLAFDGSGRLFGTDNDDDDLAAKGDELNLIERDGHYGHPYASFEQTLEVEGMVPPLLRANHLQGLVHVPANALREGLGESLFAATWFDGELKRIALDDSGPELVATAEWFADLPRVIDVTFDAANRTLYAISHDDRLVYRITAE